MGMARRSLLLAALLLSACGAVALAACSSTGEPPSTPASPQNVRSADDSGNASSDAPFHTAGITPKGDEVAVVTTSRGVIEFKFFPKDAPNTVASFIELAEKKFYDGTRWHRVEPGFVIQGGDPQSKTLEAGDPRLGTGDPGYKLRQEFNQRKHLEGTVAMARAQSPDSAGSQFYICLAPQPTLDGQYTVFGQVISGLDVVKKTQVGDEVVSVRIEHSPAGR